MTVGEKELQLNEAMEQHGDYLKGLIYSYVKDIHKTEDIVQEVFIKFYKSLARFEGRSSTKTFLYRIAVNESLNYLKSWHYRKLGFSDKIKDLNKLGSIESDHIKREQSQSIRELVSALPIKYREVIWLYYYAEFSVSEVSDVLNCSVNTVKTRLARGRKLARITMEESEVFYEY